MRAIDLDLYAHSNRNGKTMILRELERFLAENPVQEMTFSCSEWDTSLERDENNLWTVVLRKKA